MSSAETPRDPYFACWRKLHHKNARTPDIEEIQRKELDVTGMKAIKHGTTKAAYCLEALLPEEYIHSKRPTQLLVINGAVLYIQVLQYEIKKLKQDNEDLKQDNEDLEAQVAELNKKPKVAQLFKAFIVDTVNKLKSDKRSKKSK